MQSQKLDRIRNTVHRNLGKTEGHKLNATLVILGAYLPSERELADPQMALYLLSKMSQKPSKMAKAQPKLLWAISSYSPLRTVP